MNVATWSSLGFPVVVMIFNTLIADTVPENPTNVVVYYSILMCIFFLPQGGSDDYSSQGHIRARFQHSWWRRWRRDFRLVYSSRRPGRFERRAASRRPDTKRKRDQPKKCNSRRGRSGSQRHRSDRNHRRTVPTRRIQQVRSENS